MKIKYYLKEMRVHHYIKNLLVFLPLACSGQLFDTGKILMAIYAFLSFCFISSAVYFINDLKDIEKDRKHPTKCNRPIASGKIGIKGAVAFTVLIFVAAFSFNVLCMNVWSTALLLGYFVLNVGYSFGLKNVPLIDIAILVSGFIIRTIYGAMVADIVISNWLYLVVISAGFYLGLGKRRNELIKQENNDTREVIKKYPFAFLDRNMYVFMSLIFVFYSLWAVDAKTVLVYGSNLIWSVPIVMLIFMRYSFILEGNSDGDPVEVLLHDKGLVCLCSLYLVAMFMLMYVLG